MPHTARMNAEMRKCIEHCLDCHALCEETITHCLGLGNEHASAGHIGLLRDCSAICSTSGDFMLRESGWHVETCRICAMICDECAEACERMGQGDAVMKRCAELCRRCAESCAAMSGVAAQ